MATCDFNFRHHWIRSLGFAIGLSMLVFPDLVSACACEGDGRSTREAYDHYDKIVVARVVGAKLVAAKSSAIRLDERMAMTPVGEVVDVVMSVEQRLKGTAPEDISLSALEPGNSCSIPVVVGMRYLLFIHEDSQTLSKCGRSKLLTSHKVFDEVHELVGFARQE